MTVDSITPFRSQIPNLSLVRTRGINYDLTTIEGKVIVPCWQDFVLPVQRGIRQVDGSYVYLHIGGTVADKPVVTKEQVAAYEYLLEHQMAIQQSLLNTLLLDYAEWWDEYDTDTLAGAMPEVDNIEQFKPLIQLTHIHLMQQQHEGIAYTGYQFECTWEEEHALGFMAHKDRMVASGGSDISFMGWVAEGDIRDRTVTKNINPATSKESKQKPWWRFW
jgi:hypothetical protein